VNARPPDGLRSAAAYSQLNPEFRGASLTFEATWCAASPAPISSKEGLRAEGGIATAPGEDVLLLLCQSARGVARNKSRQRLSHASAAADPVAEPPGMWLPGSSPMELPLSFLVCA
jgi:hypothetical protein